MEKTITEVTNRGIRITCTLAAPVATVWEVWTNPEQIATWWGPSGFTSTIHTMDLVEGGEWRLSMFSPDGKNCPNKSIFKEIVPHTKIVFQHFNPNYMATILFEPGGPETFMDWTVLFETVELFDTSEIRKRLEATFQKYFPKYEYLITVKPNSACEAYLTFLYPNEETQEYMGNEKLVEKLVQSGVDLSQPRQADHWIYFNTKRERGLFLAYAEKEGFKLEAKKYSASSALPYSLQISRKDKVDLSSTTAITLRMRRKAKELDGDYDGWETFVVESK